MKKRSINDILGSSDNKNIKRISDSYDIISDKKKEELYSRIAARTGLGSDGDYTDKVSGVEVRRNSNILRYIGSAAACIAVIGGLSAGAFAMKGMKKVPSSEFAETTATFTAETTAEDTEEASSEAVDLGDLPEAFDDKEKLHLYDLMINSMDNFHKVSGKYVKNNTCSDIMCDIVDYQIDQDNMKAYESVARENLISPVENVVNDESFDSLIDGYMGTLHIYCTDTAQYILDNDNKTYTISAQSADVSRTGKKLDARTVAGLMYKKAIYNDFEFDYDETVFLNHSFICNTAYSSVYPFDFAYGQLYDFTAWDITGETDYAGRECYGIEGHIPYYPYEPTDNGTADFKALIDKETGCLLKYVLYDPNGGYLDWLVTKSIKFDEEADPVTIDFSAYSKYDYPDVSNEIGCNSKGETYGSNMMCATAYNYSDLPDLIAYSGVFNSAEIKGYMRKTELFEVFPISPAEQSKRCASTIKGDDTPEGIDINVYDSEGENVLFVVTYYNLPVDDIPWLGHTDSGNTFGPMTDDSYDALPDLIRYSVPDDADDTVCYIRKTDIQDILGEFPRELHIGNSFRWKTDYDTDKKEITCYDLNNNTVGTLIYDPQN